MKQTLRDGVDVDVTDNQDGTITVRYGAIVDTYTVKAWNEVLNDRQGSTCITVPVRNGKPSPPPKREHPPLKPAPPIQPRPPANPGVEVTLPSRKD